MNNCKYCQSGMNIISEKETGLARKVITGLIICEDKNYNRIDTMFVKETLLGLSVTGDEIKINYCPFCGRELFDEVEENEKNI